MHRLAVNAHLKRADAHPEDTAVNRTASRCLRALTSVIEPFPANWFSRALRFVRFGSGRNAPHPDA
jgi:hypothetical protein